MKPAKITLWLCLEDSWFQEILYFPDDFVEFLDASSFYIAHGLAPSKLIFFTLTKYLLSYFPF